MAEIAKNPGSRTAAGAALAHITLESGEVRASAANRMVLSVRAKLVDTNRPFASEETYFWRLLPNTDLADLIEERFNCSCPTSRTGFPWNLTC